MKILLALALACSSFAARAQTHEVASWFAESFLEFPHDVKEAAQDGKRLMLYFWLEGCPYCKELVEVTFRDPKIVAKTRRGFMPVAINVRGAREVTWTDGRTMSEKQLASLLEVRWTPTLVFFDEKGAIALRVSGYQAPAEFERVLNQAAGPSRD